MAKNLVIVESPAKAKTINKFIGKDYIVKASVGHVRDLPKSELGVDEETFEPKYEILEGKEKVVSELKAAAKLADNIFIASDPDREGEAIGWHVMNLLGGESQERRALCGHHQIFPYGEVVEQLRALPGSGEPPLRAHVRRQPCEIAAVELGTARGTDEPGDRVDERRLAGAVRSDQPDQLTLLDGDVDGVDGPHTPEANRQARRGEDGAHALPAGSGAGSSAFRFARA